MAVNLTQCAASRTSGSKQVWIYDWLKAFEPGPLSIEVVSVKTEPTFPNFSANIASCSQKLCSLQFETNFSFNRMEVFSIGELCLLYCLVLGQKYHWSTHSTRQYEEYRISLTRIYHCPAPSVVQCKSIHSKNWRPKKQLVGFCLFVSSRTEQYTNVISLQCFYLHALSLKSYFFFL